MMDGEEFTARIDRNGNIIVRSLYAFQMMHKGLTEGYYLEGPDDQGVMKSEWIPPHDVFIAPDGDLVYKQRAKE